MADLEGIRTDINVWWYIAVIIDCHPISLICLLVAQKYVAYRYILRYCFVIIPYLNTFKMYLEHRECSSKLLRLQ